MSAYKHYRNNSEAGAPLFITTTVLDFVHPYRREEVQDAMGYHLAREPRVGACRGMKVILGLLVLLIPLYLWNEMTAKR